MMDEVDEFNDDEDGPVEMGNYPIRLDPNVAEDFEILDRFDHICQDVTLFAQLLDNSIK